MADIFQGDALPDVTTTTETQDTAPQFYTDYLQNVANLGQNAVQQGGVAGMGGLTQQAMNLAPTTGFAGANSVGQAQDLATQAGYTGSNQIYQNYMNPYQSNVVDEMARLTNRNIQESILPSLESAGVSTGNYGSQQQQNMVGRTLRDIQSDLLGRQYGALNSGFQNAMTTAGSDLNRGLTAAQTLNQTGQTQNQIGTTGLNTLNTLGKQQQAQTQNELDNPMVQATNYAKLFGTPVIPKGQVQAKTGPGTSGQYGLSPLQQVASIASLINAYQQPNFNTKDFLTAAGGKPVAMGGSIGYAGGGSTSMDDGMGVPAGATHMDDNGNYYDIHGNYVG